MSSWFDRLIGFVSPERALQREIARIKQANLQKYSMNYRAAETTRLNGGAAALGGTADYFLESDYSREYMTNRAMQLSRNNSLARGMLERGADNVVSGGIKPQARTSDQDWNRQAEQLFYKWAERDCDVRKMSSFWELQRLAYFTLNRDGDFGVLKVRDGSIQLIEGSRIAAPPGRERDFNHVDGIDLEPGTGRPKKFYIIRRRPDETYFASARDFPERTEVSPNDFLFIARRQSPSQTRGETVFSAGAELYDHIDKLLEAVVVATRMSACFGVLIQSPSPNNLIPTTTNSAGQTAQNFNLEPGMVKTLRPGEEVKTLAPAQPQQQLDQFIRLLSRVVGLPLGMPLELALLDFSQTNYSSARASLLQAQRNFRRQQTLLIDGFLKEIWRWKVRSWIEDGVLEPNDEWDRHEWLAPGWDWVDPVKDLQAAQMSIDMGLSTVSEQVGKLGKDFQTLIQQRASELQLLTEAGIPMIRSVQTRDPAAAQEVIE